MNRKAAGLRIALLAVSLFWVFSFFAVVSFRADDWPSHGVYPNPPVQNWCGPAGATLAYAAFFVLGAGAYPIVMFGGVCLYLTIRQKPMTDPWLRVVGILLISTALAATAHMLTPGGGDAFPEGRGGLLGIGAGELLSKHFHAIGATLVLLLVAVVGAILAADEWVAQVPGLVGVMASNIKSRVPGVLERIASLRERLAGPAQEEKPKTKKKGALPETPAITVLPPEMPKAKKEKPAKEAEPEVAVAKVEEAKAPEAKKEEAETKALVPVGRIKTTTPPAAAEDGKAEKAEEPLPVVAAVVPEPAKPVVEAKAPVAEVAEPKPVEKPVERVEPVINVAAKVKQTVAPPPKEMSLEGYSLPSWDLLDEPPIPVNPNEQLSEVRGRGQTLEAALKEFGVDGQVVQIDTGPVVTMFEIRLGPGTKGSKVTGLENDLARAMKAVSVRILAPIPGKDTVGVEVPNANREMVRLKELLQSAPENTRKMAVPLYLGKDSSGQPLIQDLAQMPHCLIAGSTGSGKSVCINSIILSILYTQRPDQVKLILVDPKKVEMEGYAQVPHLMCPVVTESERAIKVLNWAVEKMKERYDLLSEAHVRNIAGYNKLSKEELKTIFQPTTEEEWARIPKRMPYIVIIVDEVADLMMTSRAEVEMSIVRLAQLARAVGIHLVLATQRPQATVITGLIKANMPCKIAFRVAQKLDSRIVLDTNGAETLTGKGDMLFLWPGSKPIRAQGTLIDDREARDAVKHLAEIAEPQFETELVQIRSGTVDTETMEQDDMFDEAVKVVLATGRGSVSLLQRRLSIGYARASRLIEAMAACGVVGDYKGSQAREAAMTLEEWETLKAETAKTKSLMPTTGGNENQNADYTSMVAPSDDEA